VWAKARSSEASALLVLAICGTQSVCGDIDLECRVSRAPVRADVLIIIFVFVFIFIVSRAQDRPFPGGQSHCATRVETRHGPASWARAESPPSVGVEPTRPTRARQRVPGLPYSQYLERVTGLFIFIILRRDAA
jgi:hypothetical protein